MKKNYINKRIHTVVLTIEKLKQPDFRRIDSLLFDVRAKL